MSEQSVEIIRRVLPQEWVVREYRPDYGLDLSVEIFECTNALGEAWEAMGETVFVQVKSTNVVESGTLRVFPRHNVEKGPLREDRSEHLDIETVRIPLETSELLTIQSMSAAVPVLLFLVELETERIYFVCLNDLIDKVILPADPVYGTRTQKTIHLPVRNLITAGNPRSARPVTSFAKRPKLYAAFEKFGYQRHELEFALLRAAPEPGAPFVEQGARDLIELVRHFLAVDLRYDFWTRMPEWKPIEWSFREISELSEFLATGRLDDDGALRAFLATSLFEFDALAPEYLERLDLGGLQRALATRIEFVWHRLSNLSRMYEEVVREWFLPTYMSHLLTEAPDDA